MKVLLTGKNAKNIADLVETFGFEITTSHPDVVISYGGDGTLLFSERLYPGIPKLPIRDSQICIKCPFHSEEDLLKQLSANALKLKEYKKLETTILYKTLTALNDFVVRNTTPIHAIRFNVNRHPEPVSGSADDRLLIGDGIVLSAAFGSTGYFKSITGRSFETGFGLAFNNTTEKLSPVFLKEEDLITFKLMRGTATLSFDNNPDIFKVDEESELVFKLSDQAAKIYEAESLRCPNCKVTR